MGQGEYIALSPKCYYTAKSTGETKMGMKGVPGDVKVSIDDFRACLHSGQSFDVALQTLTKKKNQMSRVKVTKKGLSRVFVKFRTQKDKITCAPLLENNKYM